MSVFGWSYPPGCSGPPDDDGPCEVCGNKVDDCICPECPECGEVGDPRCYKDHGMTMTPEQATTAQTNAEAAKAEAEALAALEANICPTCDGSGWKDPWDEGVNACETCRGSGQKPPAE